MIHILRLLRKVCATVQPSLQRRAARPLAAVPPSGRQPGSLGSGRPTAWAELLQSMQKYRLFFYGLLLLFGNAFDIIRNKKISCICSGVNAASCIICCTNSMKVSSSVKYRIIISTGGSSGRGQRQRDRARFALFRTPTPIFESEII